MNDHDSPDIDRGWAFVIAISYFMTKVILIGISYPSSVFYSAFLEEFEQLPSITAWATSLNAFALCFFGELANVIISSFGCRAAVVIGCVMSSVGMLLTSFSPNLPCVIFAYGLLTGTGFCIVLIPSYPMVTLYFKKYRKLAFVIGSTGNGVGVFVFPLLITFLIERYHWRGAFMILSAINLNMLVIAATYFMPRSRPEISTNTESLLPHDRSKSEGRETSARRVCIYLRQSLSLLKHWRYSVLLLSHFIWGTGLTAFYTHISNMALTRGFSKEQAAFLPSITGIAGIVGRIPMILYAHVLDLHVVGLFVMHFLILGLVLAVSGFMTNFYVMVVCCAGVGFLMSVSGLQPEVLIKIVGLENVSAAVSYSSLCFGLGMMVGGPLSGWAFELDPTYRSSFVLAGACLSLSGAMNIPSWLTCGRKSRTEETQLHL